MRFEFSPDFVDPPRDRLYYLASPFTGHDPENILEINSQAMTYLLKQGFYVFSPILHTYIISEASNQHWFWMNQDFTILKRCDALIILDIEGWESSQGVQEEIALAQVRNMPVYHLEVVYDD